MFTIVAKQPWKKLEVEGFDDLVECQMLTDYSLQEADGLKEKDKLKKKKKAKKIKLDIEDPSPTEEKDGPNEVKKRKITKIKNYKLTKATTTDQPPSTNTTSPSSNKGENMGKWDGLGVPACILRRLGEMGFTCPTPIQHATLPSAINNHSDIIAAAATGSGKTLAFGIPIVAHILEIEEEEDEEDGGGDGNDVNAPCDSDDYDEERDDFKMEEDDDNDDDNSKSKIVPENETDDEEMNGEEDNKAIEKRKLNDEKEDVEDEDDDNDEADGDDDDKENFEVVSDKRRHHLYSLILTPTRELALQVTQHISNICKYTPVVVTSVVGGISVEKQLRLLKRRPQIVVATPGRLWQLIQMNEKHLCSLQHLRHVVVDEVDRMVEKGHFEEMQLIVNYVQAHSSMVRRRQVFIFSATLAFVHKKPQRTGLMKKKPMKDITLLDKIESLKKTLHMSTKPKVVDLTQGSCMTSQRLQQFKVSCDVDQKDAMLFHLMVSSPDRTLVFANSKDAIRRLSSLFGLLHHHPCIRQPPLPLHSDMSMRQRLKNLDAFKASETGLLLATDVAARGLDIAAVGRVVHYQVPRTTENYVHRSGRTARSDKGGVSVLMVSPQEDALYRRIMTALNKTSGLDDLQINRASLQQHASIVHQARQLEVLLYRQKKQKVNADWWKQTCKEADILCSDDDDYEGDDGRHRDDDDDDAVEMDGHRKALEMKRKELMALLGATPRYIWNAHEHALAAGVTEVELEAMQELRFEAQDALKLKVLKGKVEYFGAEFSADAAILPVLHGKGALFTWSGCVLRLHGCLLGCHKSENTVMVLYANLHVALNQLRQVAKDSGRKGPVVMLAGPSDAGKSSVCRMLLNYAVQTGWTPIFVDVDVGQNDVAMPASIGATKVTHPLSPETVHPPHNTSVYPFGHTTPSNNLPHYCHLIARLAALVDSNMASDRLCGSSGVVINTCGWVTEAGRQALLHTAKCFRADRVVVLGDVELSSALSVHFSTTLLPSSPAVVKRDKTERFNKRQQRLHSYLFENHLPHQHHHHHHPADSLQIHSTPPSTHSTFHSLSQPPNEPHNNNNDNDANLFNAIIPTNNSTLNPLTAAFVPALVHAPMHPSVAFPSTPSTPSIPLTPSTPSIPLTPSTPSIPLTPSPLSIPLTLSTPSIPLTPSTPSIPLTPSTPSKATIFEVDLSSVRVFILNDAPSRGMKNRLLSVQLGGHHCRMVLALSSSPEHLLNQPLMGVALIVQVLHDRMLLMTSCPSRPSCMLLMPSLHYPHPLPH